MDRILDDEMAKDIMGDDEVEINPVKEINSGITVALKIFVVASTGEMRC